MRVTAALLDLDKSYRADGLVDRGTHHEVALRKIPRDHVCPVCKGRAIVHGHRSTTVYHAPVKNKPCLIKLDKRRLRCKVCNKTFDEAQPVLSPISPHLSVAGADHIKACLKAGMNVAEIEHASGIPKGIIAKVEATMPVGKHRLPVNLCMDEVRAFPKRIAVRRERPHMSACIYDADRRTLVEMLEGDGGPVVRKWLATFNVGERACVLSVSCDLNGSYVKLARECFPNATVYADKFHVSKLVTEAVDDVRKRIVADMNEEDKRTLNKAAKLLLTRRGNLNGRTKPKVAEALEMDSDLRVAYYTLQLFFEWSDATHTTREDMQTALKRWISTAKSTKVDEMRRCANTINRNIDCILNAWEHGRTNAIAEGLNRRIKDIIRESRGFNSFEALRRRCLLVLGHERTPKGPIPLFKRKPKKEVKAS